jgi:hypothetical protein
VGIFGLGEGPGDEVLDRLEGRRANREAVALGLDGELIAPELGELVGAARDERLTGEGTGELAVQGVPLGPVLNL